MGDMTVQKGSDRARFKSVLGLHSWQVNGKCRPFHTIMFDEQPKNWFLHVPAKVHPQDNLGIK